MAVRDSTSPRVLTAQDLRTGAVVWWAGTARWVRQFQRARVLEHTAQAEAALREALDDTGRVIAAALVPVRRDPQGRAQPLGLREGLRAGGPTNGTNRPTSRSGLTRTPDKEPPHATP